jgi:hypothetical protein
MSNNVLLASVSVGLGDSTNIDSWSFDTECYRSVFDSARLVFNMVA